MKLDLRKILVGMLLGISILLLAAIIFAITYVRNFSKAAGVPMGEIVGLVQTGLQHKSQFENRKVHFLFLGLDKRDDEFEKTTLTDTILIGSFDTSSGKLTTIPLPRDIWIPDLSTKINALYYYGGKNPQTNGIEFTEQEVEKITGVKPEFTVVLNYLELPALIDAVGGIEVNVERSFTDERYPNPDYIIAGQHTPYMTISFQQGRQEMDGARALIFVRSRESADPIEGSDLGRSKRQMLVIAALVKKLKSREVLESPKKLGALYRFWDEKVETTLSTASAIGLGLASSKNDIRINSAAIPVAASPTQHAILVNPPVSKYGLWVWEARDRDWKELKEFITSSL